MGDLISRSALIEMMEKYKFGGISNEVERDYTKESVICIIENTPTVEAVPKENVQEIVERLEEEIKEIEECFMTGYDITIINGMKKALSIVKEVGGVNE